MKIGKIIAAPLKVVHTTYGFVYFGIAAAGLISLAGAIIGSIVALIGAAILGIIGVTAFVVFFGFIGAMLNGVIRLFDPEYNNSAMKNVREKLQNIGKSPEALPTSESIRNELKSDLDRLRQSR